MHNFKMMQNANLHKMINMCSGGNPKLHLSVHPQWCIMAEVELKQMLQLHLLKQAERTGKGIISRYNELEQLRIYADPKT